MSNLFYPLYSDHGLDPQAETILDKIKEEDGEPLVSQTPEKARKCFLEKSWLGNPEGNVHIENIFIDDPSYKIPLRIYTPEGQTPFPVLVFFHGGGFVLGALDEFDPFCKYLAIGSECIVVSVGYRLAPEHKHPAAVEDAVTAIKWIEENAKTFRGDSTRIAAAGDSAGANLAAVYSIIAREKRLPQLIYQVLICPWVNLASHNTESYKYFGNGLWLSKANICWYRNHYLLNEEQESSHYVSPFLVKDFTNLPPALIITAEFDVLRDEGEAYANRLREKGIPVQLTRYNGMLHDFVLLPGLFSLANEAINEICSKLKKVFNEISKTD